MIVRDLYEPIENKEIPMRVIGFEWKTLHRKAMETIRQFADVSILQHVANDRNAHKCGISSLATRKLP